MEPDSKVKELEDELKVLKAEIRHVLLDIRDNLLDRANPLEEEHEGAYLRMDLNTTARAMAAEAAGREAARVVEPSPGEAIEAPKAEEPRAEQRDEPKAEEPTAEQADEPKAEEPPAEQRDEPKAEEPTAGQADEPKAEEPTAEQPDEPKAEEPTAEQPIQSKAGRTRKSKGSRKGKKKEPEPTVEPAAEPADTSVRAAELPLTDGLSALADWVAEAMTTVEREQLERVIAMRRLWGDLPPSTCEALVHLQELVRSSDGRKLSWLEALRALEELTPS